MVVAVIVPSPVISVIGVGLRDGQQLSRGVDCYDNPHCQCTQPEPYHPRKNNYDDDD
jgi:hypothetical protein